LRLTWAHEKIVGRKNPWAREEIQGEPAMSVTSPATRHRYRSIFSDSTPSQRRQNFEDYLAFTRAHSGELLEADKDLTKKRERLARFRAHPVRSRRPLADPAAFYRNYVVFRDDPSAIDGKTLLWTCVYKFARHEWVGISAAWDAGPRLADSKTTVSRISRFHLAEEFCHIRYFEEMFRTFELDRVAWVPLGPLQQRLYGLFPHIPGALKDSLAFVTELLGVTFYRHIDALLDQLLGDEPEARLRVRDLLYEITVDELAHVGQRRNFLGSLAIRVARRLVAPFFRAFLRDMPESHRLLDIDQMVRDGLAFDYSGFPTPLLERTWIPSYCRLPDRAAAP
jgi:hypothetical protein